MCKKDIDAVEERLYDYEPVASVGLYISDRRSSMGKPFEVGDEVMVKGTIVRVDGEFPPIRVDFTLTDPNTGEVYHYPLWLDPADIHHV